MKPFQRLEARLKTGKAVILDGAVGTELERLGASMDQDVWCARALADCPDLVRQVHCRYIDAGADVITTNSFAATREAMQRNGLAAHFEDWNRCSVRLALEARDGSARAESIAVAGSVSSYGRFDKLDLETISDHFWVQGEILVDEGVDLLILETLGSTLRTIKAMVKATRGLGVPVWVSISCVRDRDTGAIMLGIEESSKGTDVMETYGPLGKGGTGDHVRRWLGCPHDALGPECDRGRRQDHAGNLRRTGWCIPQRRLLDTTELDFRRSGVTGCIPDRCQTLG